MPAKRQNLLSTDHSLYVRRRDTWVNTNALKHVDWVRSTRRQDEMRLMKLWGDQHNLDWLSFCVELTAARALEQLVLPDTLSGNLRRVLEFARDQLEGARLADPANGNNIDSDLLTGEEKRAIVRAAAATLRAADWTSVVLSRMVVVSPGPESRPGAPIGRG